MTYRACPDCHRLSGHAGNCPGGPSPRDAAIQRALDHRAEELASDGCDARDSLYSSWVRDQCEDDLAAVILALEPESGDECERARLRLRERFIQECRELYADEARAQLMPEPEYR